MSYIGRGTESISNVEVLDNLTFNGSASYTLQKSSVNFVPSSANNLLISISGVVQQGNFSVSGSTITFDTTVSASDTCDWILHYGTGLITTVADGAITEAKLGSNAVTTAKINNGAITSAKLDSGLALGKIGQVVQVLKTNTGTTSTTVYEDVLSGTITPTSTSSKILIQVVVHCGSSASGLAFHSRLTRDGTAIGIGDSAGSRTSVTASLGEDVDYSVYSMRPLVINYLDSPSSTSSLSYKWQLKTDGNVVYINRTANDSDSSGFPRTISTMMLWEVLA